MSEKLSKTSPEKRKRKKRPVAPYLLSAVAIGALANATRNPFLRYPGFALSGGLLGFALGQHIQNVFENI